MATAKKKTAKKSKKTEEQNQTPTSAVEDVYAMMKRHPRMTMLMAGYILGWISHTVMF